MDDVKELFAGLRKDLQAMIGVPDPATTPDPAANATPDPSATPAPTPTPTPDATPAPDAKPWAADLAAVSTQVEAITKALGDEGDVTKTLAAFKQIFDTYNTVLDKAIDRIANLEKHAAVKKGLDVGDGGPDPKDEMTGLRQAVQASIAGAQVRLS